MKGHPNTSVSVRACVRACMRACVRACVRMCVRMCVCVRACVYSVKGFIQNSTVGYFLGRVAQFLEAVGIKKFRFRQHKPKEMAHYAQDCWDAEILSSYVRVFIARCYRGFWNAAYWDAGMGGVRWYGRSVVLRSGETR